jgi:hypothetical protein
VTLGGARAEVLADDLLKLGAGGEGDVEGVGDGGEGDVIVGGPDAAAGEEEVVGEAEGADLGGDGGAIVEHHDDAAELDAEGAKELGEREEVGLLDLSAEQLITDEESGGGARHQERPRSRRSMMALE